MIYPITLYGDPVLRKVAEPVELNTKELNEFIENMFETMKNADGVGLAAPQVGKSWRVFVTDATGYADKEPELANFRRAFINPEILERSVEVCVMNEGCLSIPDIHEDITRPAIIKIKYYDENMVEHTDVFGGFAARVIQHEYDHLDGILHIDDLSVLKRRMLKGKLSAISKGKIDTFYHVQIPGKK